MTSLKENVLHPRSDVRLAGDDTGATRTLVYLTESRIGVFTSWAELLRAVPCPLVSPVGCQFMLAYGLVPPPFTLYQDVYALGIGDRLRIAGGDAELFVDFPYLEAKSSARERSDPKRLKELLARGVERAIGGREALLMQSGGKDSAALLIGLAACGATGVRSATYRPHYREDEAPHAAELARRFGIRHEVVDADPKRELELLLEVCGSAPMISSDVALAGYLRTLEGAGARGGVILDGLGGDVYMGYVQPRQEALLSSISLPRVRPRWWGGLEPKLPGAAAAYALKSALMFPSERCISGSHLSPRAVRELIPIDTPFSWFFEKLDRRVEPMRPTDRRAYVRGRIYDGAGTMEKARAAARRFGAEVTFPLCDRELIAHYFHLPRAEKYDEKKRITKLPLRALLQREIGESRFFEEKGSFRYDVLRFARENRGVIEAEIRAAGRALVEVDRWLEFLTARIGNYVHAYSLFTLFLLSAWLNRRPSASLELLLEDGAHRSAPLPRISP